MKDQNRASPDPEATQSSPDMAECRLLFQLVRLAMDRGDLVHAIDLLRNLQISCPNNPFYLRALGEALLEQQDYVEALACLRQSLALEPEKAETHFFCGLATQALGQISSARRYYARAVQLDPDWTEAWFNLGVLDLQLGEAGAAEQNFRRCLATRPDWPPALLNLGTVLFETGRADQALANWQKALSLDPDNARIHYNLGRCFQAAHQLEKAVSAYHNGLAIDPGMAKACLNLGKCHHDLGRYQEAVRSYEKAIAIDPEYAQAWYNLAASRLCQGDYQAVTTCYRKVVSLQPDNDAALLNLAVALRKQEQIDAAIDQCKKALEISPQFREARAYLYQLSQHACDWELAASLAPALDEDTRCSLAQGLKPGESPMLSLRRHGDPKRHLEVAKAWSHWISLEISDTRAGLDFNLAPERYAGERLRIGYISNDFKDHAVAHQIRGLLAAHDRRRFEVFAYACNPPDPSIYQQRFKQDCDHFVHLHGMTDLAAAQRIYDDRIQLLVDLMGHTQGSRHPILAMRPAPVQIGYLGFLGTSGADYIDYFITDAVVTPAEQARYFTEKLIYLPHCYQVNDDAMPVPDPCYRRADFGLKEKDVVFCCFNQPYKIDRILFDAWMSILQKVPNGVLWLLNQNAAAARNLKQAAAEAGIRPQRLIFSGALRIDRHLSRLLLADMALDPFVYNGGATTSNALWAGLPVITLMGSHLLSRMSASALLAVELGQLVAQSPEQYVRLAVALARDPQQRQALRRHLQQGRGRFPLFDTARFARHLALAYVRIWDHYKNGLTDISFSVESYISGVGDQSP